MVRLMLKLQIDGDPDDASYVVDELLDAGVLQDAIHDHEFEAGPLRVTAASIDSVEEGESDEKSDSLVKA